jgi:hypothetical protein
VKEREAALTDRNDGNRELVETPGRGKPTAMERLVKTYGDRTYRRPGQSAEIPLEDVLPPFHEDGRHAGGILDWSANVDEASRGAELRRVFFSARRVDEALSPLPIPSAS